MCSWQLSIRENNWGTRINIEHDDSMDTMQWEARNLMCWKVAAGL